MLLTLQQQYSRIQLLKEVYATARVKEHVAVVYRLGIEFTRQAALYYSIGTFRRFLYLLSRPPSVGIEVKVSEIKTAIDEMRIEMDTLDRIRLSDVEKKLGDVEVKVERVEQSVKGNSQLHHAISPSYPDLQLNQPSIFETTMTALRVYNTCSGLKHRIWRRLYPGMIRD